MLTARWNPIPRAHVILVACMWDWNVNVVAQGSIGAGVKLEDGKGTAASGFFLPKQWTLCKYRCRSQQCDENVPKTGWTWHQWHVHQAQHHPPEPSFRGGSYQIGDKIEDNIFRWDTSLETRRRQELFLLSLETENSSSGISQLSSWRVSRFREGSKFELQTWGIWHISPIIMIQILVVTWWKTCHDIEHLQKA